MKHYYFKFGKQNNGLDKFFEQKQKNNKNVKRQLEIDEIVPLSIFFGKWKTDQYDEVYLKAIKGDQQLLDDYNIVNNSVSVKQVDLFFEIGHSKDSVNNVVFWIFHKENIYALQPITSIRNGDDIYIDEDKSMPKTIDCKVVKIFPKDKLPEQFTTLNANQGYNRRTIQKLDRVELEIAEYIFQNLKEDFISEQRIKINPKRNRLEYLSPIQFETLIFLIFYEQDAFCSTYRGGTLEDIDLKIEIPNNLTIDGLASAGKYNLQVKFKIVPNYTCGEKTFLIHLGKSDPSKNILGIDWIDTQIKKQPKVEEWLKRSLAVFCD